MLLDLLDHPLGTLRFVNTSITILHRARLPLISRQEYLINILQAHITGLRIEEIDNRHKREACAHEDEVGLPVKPIYEHGRNHNHEEIPRPMAGYTDCGSSRAGFERKDFGTVDPGYDVDGAAEYQHVEEEEGNSGDGGMLLVERQQDRAHHHADTETADPDHHGLTATHPVECESRDEVSDDEHEFDEAGDELSFSRRKTDALDEESGHVVDDPDPSSVRGPWLIWEDLHIDANHLVHE